MQKLKWWRCQKCIFWRTDLKCILIPILEKYVHTVIIYEYKVEQKRILMIIDQIYAKNNRNNVNAMEIGFH